jgi:hypothetical protein
MLPAALLILSGGIGLAFGEEPRDELYDELSAALGQAEALVAGMALEDGTSVTEEQLEALRILNRQIRGSLYSDLIDRSDLLLLLAQEQMLFRRGPEAMQVHLEEMLRDSREEAHGRKRSSVRDKVLRASLTVSLVSFATAFGLWGLGELQDRRYFESTSSREAEQRRRLFQAFSIGSIVGAAVGGIGAGVSVTLYAGGP